LIIVRVTCQSRGSSTAQGESDEKWCFMFDEVFGED